MAERDDPPAPAAAASRRSFLTGTATAAAASFLNFPRAEAVDTEMTQI